MRAKKVFANVRLPNSEPTPTTIQLSYSDPGVTGPSFVTVPRNETRAVFEISWNSLDLHDTGQRMIEVSGYIDGNPADSASIDLVFEDFGTPTGTPQDDVFELNLENELSRNQW